MHYKVMVSEHGEKDVDEILDYLVLKLRQKKAGEQFLDDFEKSITYLEENPFMYEYSRDERLKKMGYRKFVIGNYVVLYTVDEKVKRVYIARLFYGRQEYSKLL